MNWLFIALAAHIILGTSAVFDKILLKRGKINPAAYAFFLGLMGGVAILAGPFGGFQIAPIPMAIALLSGVFFIVGMFGLFAALAKGEASATLPLIGALSAFCTFLFGAMLLRERLGTGDIFGFILLVAGGLLFFLAEKKEARRSVFLLAAAAALFLALSNVLAKEVFGRVSFVPGFVWIKIGGVAASLLFFAFSFLRRKILSAHRETASSHKILYAANRAYAGIGSLLVGGALALGHPALVDAMQGVKFAVIFIVGAVILRERRSRKNVVLKIAAVCAISAGVGWLGLAGFARSIPVDPSRPITWGATFSAKYSRALGLDWKENFRAIADELHPKKIRIAAYWDEIERSRGDRDFSEVDWMLGEARRAGIPVVLAVGMRLPRWPECHVPDWAEDLPLGERESEVRMYMKAAVERYRNDPVIEMWQVENEPFLAFGECKKREAGFLKKEIDLVKSLDPSRPILVTDGGEFGSWTKAIRAGDIFGTTMYREVYPPSVGFLTGIIRYPLDASFFRLRQKAARLITGAYGKRFIVAELQSEPWGRVEIPLLSYEEQTGLFSPEYFNDTIYYARNAGFDEYYLWGAEWWFFVKKTHGDSRYWERAKRLFEE